MGTVDFVVGQVLGVNIKDEFIMPDGKLDILKMQPIGLLGYYVYTCIESVFEMVIPGLNEDVRLGMEGRRKNGSESEKLP